MARKIEKEEREQIVPVMLDQCRKAQVKILDLLADYQDKIDLERLTKKADGQFVIKTTVQQDHYAITAALALYNVMQMLHKEDGFLRIYQQYGAGISAIRRLYSSKGEAEKLLKLMDSGTNTWTIRCMKNDELAYRLALLVLQIHAGFEAQPAYKTYIESMKANNQKILTDVITNQSRLVQSSGYAIFAHKQLTRFKAFSKAHKVSNFSKAFSARNAESASIEKYEMLRNDVTSKLTELDAIQENQKVMPSFADHVYICIEPPTVTKTTLQTDALKLLSTNIASLRKLQEQLNNKIDELKAPSASLSEATETALGIDDGKEDAAMAGEPAAENETDIEAVIEQATQNVRTLQELRKQLQRAKEQKMDEAVKSTEAAIIEAEEVINAQLFAEVRKRAEVEQTVHQKVATAASAHAELQLQLTAMQETQERLTTELQQVQTAEQTPTAEKNRSACGKLNLDLQKLVRDIDALPADEKLYDALIVHHDTLSHYLTQATDLTEEQQHPLTDDDKTTLMQASEQVQSRLEKRFQNAIQILVDKNLNRLNNEKAKRKFKYRIIDVFGRLKQTARQIFRLKSRLTPTNELVFLNQLRRSLLALNKAERQFESVLGILQTGITTFTQKGSRRATATKILLEDMSAEFNRLNETSPSSMATAAA